MLKVAKSLLFPNLTKISLYLKLGNIMTNAEAINARKQAAKDLLECTKPHTKAAKKHDKKNG